MNISGLHTEYLFDCSSDDDQMKIVWPVYK